MFHNKQKLKCHEKETITEPNGNDEEKLPKKEIELSLEVEMDDEVRDIITSPEKCLSTLLDVTVIKPQDVNVDHVYTQKKILNGDEVRKLITIMELEKQGKQKLINQILSKDVEAATSQRHNNPKSAGDYVKTRQFDGAEKKISPRYRHLKYMDGRDSAVFFEQVRKPFSTDGSNSEICSNAKRNMYKHAMKGGDNEIIQQIYTTPRTYNDIKSIFSCKNKSRYENNEKPNKPCLCQNCAILGVLTDSQKRPFVTENLYDPRDFIFGNKKEGKENKTRRKKSVNFKEDSHVECHYYFKHLSAKIKDLEERLAIQEERSVPRDYFKRIITKLVAHISKLTSYGSQDKFSPQKCKDYKDMHRTKDAVYGTYGNKYHVHSALIDQKPGKVPAERECGRLPEESIPTTSCFNSARPPQPSSSHDGVWKWGGEILKPGIDLKNKIMILLEDTIQNLKKPQQSKAVGNTRAYADVLPKNLPKTVADVPVRDVNSKQARNSRHADSIVNYSEIKYEKKCKRMLPRIFSKGDVFFEEPVNISYMNPRLSKWQEESMISFKFESSDIESLKKTEEKVVNDSYKTEFLDTLVNTKEVDKLTLWQSIWNQAKINGQTKQDKVTIQIPDRKNLKSQRMIEIEYTIAELEKLLTGRVVGQKN